jgi:hypothetical protein
MAVQQPLATTLMNEMDHALMHRQIAADDNAAVQTIAVQGDSTTRIGDADGTDYSEIEAAGTLRFNGAARVWRDSMVPATSFRTGGTALTFDALTANIFAYRFDVNDEIHFAVQFNHDIYASSIISPHIHLVNKKDIGALNYNVAVDFRYTWTNINKTFPSEQSELNTKLSFQNALALSHKVLGFADIAPTADQGGVSSILMGTVKRVAASLQPYNTNDIYILGLDMHYQCDTVGSRQEYIK